MSVSSFCPFCDKTQEFRFMADTLHAKVIYPKSPAVDLHFLIVPKRHVQQFHELSKEELYGMHSLLNTLHDFVSSEYTNFEGYNLLSNNGSPSVNQQVPHAHMHAFFRRAGDPDPFTSSKHTAHIDFTDNQLKFIASLKNKLNP